MAVGLPIKMPFAAVDVAAVLDVEEGSESDFAGVVVEWDVSAGDSAGGES